MPPKAYDFRYRLVVNGYLFKQEIFSNIGKQKS